MQHIRYIILIVFLTPLICLGQQKAGQQVDDVLLTEEIILSTDRDFYLTGEKIWFSATVLLNGKKVSTDFSRIMFVELIGLNQSQYVVSKHQITNGMVHDVIDIPEGLATAWYVLRAYTTYQQNNGPSAFAEKAITILNPTLALVGVEDDPKQNFEAFALKAAAGEQNRFGIHIPVAMLRNKPKIWVAPPDTSMIYPVRYFDNGLAYYTNGNYEESTGLKLFYQSKSDEAPKIFDLQVKRGSYLNAEQKGNSVSVKGQISDAVNLSTIIDTIYLLNAHHEVVGSQILSFREKKFNSTFAVTNMKYGLYYAVLKTKNHELIAADAFLYKKPAREYIKVSVDNKTYGIREEVKLNIKFTNDQSEIDNYSVAVVAGSTVSDDKDIPSYLIPNPGLLNAFMQETTAETKEARIQLEILLGLYTKQMLNNFPDLLLSPREKKDEYYVDARGVNLSGKLRHKTTKDPVQGIDVYLSVFGEKPQLQIYTTDLDGSFRFLLRHVADLTNIYLVYNAPGQNELEMLINKDYTSQFPPYKNVEFIPDTSMKGFIEDAYMNAQITESYFDQISINPIEKEAWRFHEPDGEIYLDDYVSMPSFEAVLNELVPYTRVKRKGKKAYFEVLDRVTNIGYDNPLILLDDLPVFDVDQLLEINPAKIKSVKVINTTYVYGDHVLKGIIIISTKTENFGGYPLPASFTAIEYNAARSPSSYVPVIYDQKTLKEGDRIPDFRNLIYWNPQLKPSAYDTVISFYTSDYKSDYKVIIHGVSRSGQPFSTQTAFTVK